MLLSAVRSGAPCGRRPERSDHSPHPSPTPPVPCSRISAEEAQRALKDMVFSRWLGQGCEERSDTLKMVREARRCVSKGVCVCSRR